MEEYTTGYEQYRTCDLLYILKTLIRKNHPQEDINMVAIELAKRNYFYKSKKSFFETAQEFGYAYVEEKSKQL